jgi:hypothetical protein
MPAVSEPALPHTWRPLGVRMAGILFGGRLLVVVNGYRRREYEWAEVLAVHLPPGAPWATLDLADGTSQPAMGIQGSDGARAHRAVAELRLLISRAAG